jgi:hypothetical protein
MLKHGDMTVVLPRRRLYNFDEAALDVWSPATAYALGVILTDGSVATTDAGYDSHYLALEAKDREMVEIVREVLKHPKPLLHTRRKYWKLHACSKKLVTRLLELGITPAKSLTVQMPPVPDEFLPHFLRGVVDGDGSINMPPHSFQLTINSASHAFLSELAKRLRFKGSLFECGKGKRKNPLYRLAYSGAEAMRLCEWMYAESEGLRLSRKYDRYLIRQSALQGA